MVATNMQYFSAMPSVSFVLDHTRLDKGGGSTEEEQCTNTRQMYQVTGCSSTAARLKTLRKLSRSNRGMRVTNFRDPSHSSGT